MSIPGGTQNSAGHGPVQLSIEDPALSRAVELNDAQRCLPISAVLWFCDFVFLLHHLTVLPPLICVLFMSAVNQELLVHPCTSCHYGLISCLLEQTIPEPGGDV